MQQNPDDRPRPLREICDGQVREWLLVKILDPHVPSGDAPCLVLARGTRAEMFKVERKVRKQDPTALLAIEGRCTKFGDGEALRQALARIAAEEDWVSANNW